MQYTLRESRVKKVRVRTQEQQERYERLEKVREKVRTLPCPKCNALTNARCVSTTGTTRLGKERISNHAERHQQALAAGIVVKGEADFYKF